MEKTFYTKNIKSCYIDKLPCNQFLKMNELRCTKLTINEDIHDQKWNRDMISVRLSKINIQTRLGKNLNLIKIFLNNNLFLPVAKCH